MRCWNSKGNVCAKAPWTRGLSLEVVNMGMLTLISLGFRLIGTNLRCRESVQSLEMIDIG